MGQSTELDSHAIVRVLLKVHLSFANCGLILLTSLEADVISGCLVEAKQVGDPSAREE